MAHKRKSSEAVPLPIESTFRFNRPIDWTPSPIAASASADLPSGASTSTSPPSTPRISTIDDLKKELATRVQGEIARLKAAGSRHMENTIKKYSALRAVLLEPTSRPFYLDVGAAGKHKKSATLDWYFEIMLDTFARNIDHLVDTWINKSAAYLEQVSRGQKDEDADPDSQSKAAQQEVPIWYQRTCVLTGVVGAVDAAQIVEFEGTNLAMKPTKFWTRLRMFWALEAIKDLSIAGQESRNILPLAPPAHRLFDRNKFALRPVLHPTNPEHRMYLQFVWFKDRHVEIGISDDAERRLQVVTQHTGLTDRRRLKDSTGGDGRAGNIHVVHGDVYELSTSDPEARPLPRFQFLQMRYAMQQLFAGQQAPATLRAIFDHYPPADDADDHAYRDLHGRSNEDLDPDEYPGLDEAFFPRDWDWMIRDARELGILSREREHAWRAHLHLNGYETGMARVETYLREIGRELWNAEEEEEEEEDEEVEEVEEVDR